MEEQRQEMLTAFNEVIALVGESKDTTEAMAALNTKVQGTFDALETASTKVADLEAAATSKEAELTKANEDLAAANESLSTAQADLATANAEKESLETQLADAKQAAEMANTTNDEWEAEREAKLEQITQLETEKSTLVEEKGALETKVTDLEAANTELSNELDKIPEEVRAGGTIDNKPKSAYELYSEKRAANLTA